MNQSINDLDPGTIMLVVKNENGTFSPLGLTPMQSIFLHNCIGALSEESPLVRDKDTELYVKHLNDEKERDNGNGDN